MRKPVSLGKENNDMEKCIAANLFKSTQCPAYPGPSAILFLDLGRRSFYLYGGTCEDDKKSKEEGAWKLHGTVRRQNVFCDGVAVWVYVL